MKLLLFATLSEAIGSIQRLGAREKTPSTFTYDGGLIVITGMGSMAALSAVLREGQEVDEIYNLGIAGALNPALTIGSFELIETVGKFTSLNYDLDPRSTELMEETLPRFPLKTRGLRLLTSDFPIYHSPTTHNLREKWDLVDMEGYGVAYGAALLKKKCILGKIVSDFASENGRELIFKNTSKLSEMLAEKYFSLTRL
jgi:adenosylhomocysteine nucleosidase